MTKMYWVHAMSPIHVGSGEGAGLIDLPILREKTTNWPYLPGSSIKGVLSDHHNASKDKQREGDGKEETLRRAAFGIGGNEHSNAGSLVFTDCRLAAMPARSLYGTFAYVSSNLALRRLHRDLTAVKVPNIPDIGTAPASGNAFIAQGSAVASGSPPKLFVGDFDFKATLNDAATKWASFLAQQIFPTKDDPWRTEFLKRFAILPDDDFTFLTEFGTEVNAHIKIDPGTGVVQRGALWYEECIPAEGVLAGMVWCDKIFVKGKVNGEPVTEKTLMDKFCGGELPLQIGGKATVGKGRIRCVFGA